MKIGAYQFPVTKEITENFKHMEEGARTAAKEGVRILAFGECALTGYPEGNAEHIRAIAECDLESFIESMIFISFLAP